MKAPPLRCDNGCRGSTNMIFRVLFVVLLVFGAGATAADPPAETPSASKSETTTSPIIFDCNAIPSDTATENIIKHCKGFDTTIKSINGDVVFYIKNIQEKELNDFFESFACAFNLDITIENDNNIATLNFGRINAFDSFREFTLKNNYKLKNVQGGHKRINIDNNAKVTVRGNRYLTAASINKLKEMTKGNINADIQDEKECIVPSLIKDLKDLNDCGSVYGDLTFANWPIGTTSNEIKWVTGNLKIVNTDLTKLPFSQTEKIKIDGNFEFQDNAGLCWINDENYKDYFEVKGKVKVRNTPCPHTPSAPINTTTKKTKKSKKTTTTAAPTVTEETTTTKNSDTVLAVIPAFSALFIILL